MSRAQVLCPDLGDFKDVPVIEVLVKPGDRIELETPMITLETDKATMDVPSTVAGTVVEVLVSKDGKVSKGTPLLWVETAGESSSPTPSRAASAAAPDKAAPPPAAATAAEPAAGPSARSSRKAPKPSAEAPKKSGSNESLGSADEPKADRSTHLLVLGSGPGGYTAAFRAADLGLKVTLVERDSTLGGVCLNVGCIPSKALLHAAKVVEDARAMAAHGIQFGAPRIDTDKLRAWKSAVVKKLTGGLSVLAKQRKVEVLRGVGKFVSPHVLELRRGSDSERIRFEYCIIAAGSESMRLPFLPQDERIIDSTGALELPNNPGRLLVIGGGIIGLEMACVYDALGAKVSVVELTAQLMPGCDPDLIRPLEKRIRARYAEVLLNTQVTAVKSGKSGLQVSFSTKDGASSSNTYDHVLVAVGRTPNGKLLGAEAAGVQVDDRGYIGSDARMRTNVRHIFSIGDVRGPPMLAHKATHEAKVAAEMAAGHKSSFDARVIPSVAYTDPEIAWVGLTESAAKAQNIAIERGVFPWAASGRSLSIGRDEGFTKLLFDPATHRLLGGGIVGTNAGELIAEVALAIETGADAADIGLTVHAHPTLSETVAFAAEAVDGTLTDLYLPKKG
ncbi:MAG: dihydrolipoyl dehydrogenase [Steroidobacteraceae bacterium]